MTPSKNTELVNVSYGETPENYQKILKNYLIKNLKDYKTAKVEFINELVNKLYFCSFIVF